MNHITAKEARDNCKSSRFGVWGSEVDQLFDDIKKKSEKGIEFLLFDTQRYEKLWGFSFNQILFSYFEELGYTLEPYKNNKCVIKW